MKKINGFTVIATKPGTPGRDTLLILAVKEHPHVASGFEYVTAWVASLEDKEWFCGHYSVTIDQALRDFHMR